MAAFGPDSAEAEAVVVDNNIGGAVIHGHSIQVGVIHGDFNLGAVLDRAERQEGLAECVPLDRVRDPFALEVHRPIRLDTNAQGRELPEYVRRSHDDEITRLVDRVLAGASGMAVLVAGSSAGKTRACWEALRPLRDVGGWTLWHPRDPTRRDAALNGMDLVGPHTVVWLNETQEYLGDAGGSPEAVAAKLHRLLHDQARAPVLILGTLWPEHHDMLTRSPQCQVTQLLDGAVIKVARSFTGPDLAALEHAASQDPLLARAVENAADGQITQYLAGGPELEKRYQTAPAAARAVIEAAMDARRMGHRYALPLSLLENAAQAYLSGTEWHELADGWIEQALAYTGKSCKGVLGPVTVIRPRPLLTRTSNTSRHTDEETGEPLYELADYLEHWARSHRAGQIPPTGFWFAAAAHAHTDDLATLGDAAWDRGLYRAAAQLYKNGTTCGNPAAGEALIDHLRSLHPGDRRAAHHAAAHVCLDRSSGAGSLLRKLHEDGAAEQIGVLLARNPAAHLSFDSAWNTADLLWQLRKVGASEQIAVLLARNPVAFVPLDSSYAITMLLRQLRGLKAREEIAVLLARDPAAQVSLDDPLYVAYLVEELQKLGAGRQAAALAGRFADDFPLDAPRTVSRWLQRLHQAAAGTVVDTLLARAPAACAALDDPDAVAELLVQLNDMRAHRQVEVLASRAIDHVPLHDPRAVTCLLKLLSQVSARKQLAELLALDPATQVCLEDPFGVVELLWQLTELGASEQIDGLLARSPGAHSSVDCLASVGILLEVLSEAGAGDEATLLARRAVLGSPLYDPHGVASMLESLRRMRADELVAEVLDRNPAAQVSLDDPGGVAMLLRQLAELGATEQIAVLLKRDPAAHAGFEYPYTYSAALLAGALSEVGADDQLTKLCLPAAAQAPGEGWLMEDHLLQHLTEMGVGEQVGVVLARDPIAAEFLGNPYVVAWLLEHLRAAGADKQIAMLLAREPSARVSLDSPTGVVRLLRQLTELGDSEQVTVLLARNPIAHMRLDEVYDVTWLLDDLTEVGAHYEATVLAQRIAATGVLDNEHVVERLLGRLREMGAEDALTVLGERLPAAGMFQYFTRIGDHGERFRFGREPDGTPAAAWAWDDLDQVRRR